MTAIEWIELAQEKIRNAAFSSAWRFNNVPDIEDALKCLNEAKALINEHQDRLLVKVEDVLITKCQEA